MSVEIEVLSQERVSGRPTKYDHAYCEGVIECAKDGGTLDTFAAQIGVCTNSLRNWCKAHEEFFDAVSIARAHCAAWYVQRMRDIALGKGGPGAATMVMFALKNLAPDSYQERAQLEHVGQIQHRMTHEEALGEAARRGLPTRIFDE